MAYVYNQNQDEQQAQGSNIFAPAGQNGQQQGQSQSVDKTGPSNTLTAGVGAPTRGEYRGQQRSSADVSQQSAQQRQARLPLQEIYRRNQPGQIAAPDFSKTRSAIAGAVSEAQNAANQYTASQVGKVASLSDQDVTDLTTGNENVTNKARGILLPGQQANLSEAFTTNAAVPADINARFGTSAGLVGEVGRSRRAQPGETRGATNLDVSFLQQNPEFLNSASDVVKAADEANKKIQGMMTSVPEDTRQAVQTAIDNARAAAKAAIENKAKTYSNAADTARNSYENARANLQAALNTGSLTPEMVAKLNNFLSSNFDPSLYSTGAYQFAQNLLFDPNRNTTLSNLGADIDRVAGTNIPANTYQFDPSQVFSVASTPSNATSFMSDEQFTPYSRLMALLGTPVVRGNAPATDMLNLTPEKQAALRNYFNDAALMYDTRQGQIKQAEGEAAEAARQEALAAQQAKDDAAAEQQRKEEERRKQIQSTFGGQFGTPLKPIPSTPTVGPGIPGRPRWNIKDVVKKGASSTKSDVGRAVTSTKSDVKKVGDKVSSGFKKVKKKLKF